MDLQQTADIGNDAIGDIGGGNDDGDDGASFALELRDTPPSQRSAAMFLMGLKEKYMITQVALQGVIEGVTNLVQSHLDICTFKFNNSFYSLVFHKQQLMGFSPFFQSVEPTLILSRA